MLASITGQAATPAPQASKLEANKQIVRRFAEEVWNQGNLDVLDEIMAPNAAAFVAGAPPVPPGPEGNRAFIAAFREAFPDIHYQVHDLVAEGDQVAASWTFEATHQGEFQGFPPTGNRVTVHGASFFRIENGQIVSNWVTLDTVALLQGVGALPTPGTPATAILPA